MIRLKTENVNQEAKHVLLGFQAPFKAAIRNNTIFKHVFLTKPCYGLISNSIISFGRYLKLGQEICQREELRMKALQQHPDYSCLTHNGIRQELLSLQHTHGGVLNTLGMLYSNQGKRCDPRYILRILVNLFKLYLLICRCLSGVNFNNKYVWGGGFLGEGPGEEGVKRLSHLSVKWNIILLFYPVYR